MPTLDWIGKKAVLNHHRQVPFRLLKCDEKLSVGDPNSGNLLIQGDNLEALKALLPYYAGQVKCIYIDPPYNTGNEGWIYNDNVNSPEMRSWLGRVVGDDAEDLSRHDKWLCMMYPRLSLLKQFLRRDGAIFISIDDNEIGHLRLLMNEIFGCRNFVCNFVWQKKHTRANDAKYVSDNHDFIVFYANDIERLSLNRLSRSEEANARFRNPDNDPRGPWISQPLQVKTPSEAYIYEITTPSGRKISPPVGRSWAFSRERLAELMGESRIYFGSDGKNVPRLKKFLDEVGRLVPLTIWPRTEVGDNQEAKSEVKRLLKDTGASFDSPKPVRLIERIIEIATQPDSIILDSFCGSGTTGQAVMQANASDGGTRRFVMVEIDPAIFSGVTEPRLSKACKEIMSSSKGNQGFRVCTLGRPLFDEQGKIAEHVRFPDLAAHVFFTETGVPLPKMPRTKSPMLGVHQDKAVYLLFNGIMGDKRPDGGNVLTSETLGLMPPHNGPRVIYGEGCRLSPQRLRKEGILFKQIPYEIKVG